MVVVHLQFSSLESKGLCCIFHLACYGYFCSVLVSNIIDISIIRMVVGLITSIQPCRTMRNILITYNILRINRWIISSSTLRVPCFRSLNSKIYERTGLEIKGSESPSVDSGEATFLFHPFTDLAYSAVTLFSRLYLLDTQGFCGVASRPPTGREEQAGIHIVSPLLQEKAALFWTVSCVWNICITFHLKEYFCSLRSIKARDR